MNLYQVLDIHSSATGKEIKMAYHRQVKKYNPNKDASNHAMFTDVIFAYSILSNESTKFVYDMLGPECLEYLKTQTTLRVICAIVNPANVFLVFMAMVIIASTLILATVGFYFMLYKDVRLFITGIFMNIALFILDLDLIALRIFLRFRNSSSRFNKSWFMGVIILEILVLLQCLLLLFRIDFQWNINIVLVCIPYILMEIAICGSLVATGGWSLLVHVLPFMFRMTVLLLWSTDFPAIINVLVVILIFAQYLIMNYIGFVVFVSLISFYMLLVAPFVMIYYDMVGWYTFIPTGVFVFLFVAVFVSGEAIRRRRHFYKRLSECVTTTNYLKGESINSK